MPQWYNDGTGSWHTSWEDFLAYCQNCWRIYEVDNVALIYVQRFGDKANIHFSLLRGSKVDFLKELIDIRNDLLLEVELLFGFVGRHNPGLKRIIEQVGFSWKGFSMILGESHGRVLHWRCYSVHQDQLFIRKNVKSLLTLAPIEVSV